MVSPSAATDDIEKLRRADSALRETIFQLSTIIGTLPEGVRNARREDVGVVAERQTAACIQRWISFLLSSDDNVGPRDGAGWDFR